MLHGDGPVVEKLFHDDLVLVMALAEKLVAHMLVWKVADNLDETGHQGLEEGMFNDAEWKATPIQELSNLFIQVIFGSCWSPHHMTVEVSLTLLGWWWIRAELESSSMLGLLSWCGLENRDWSWVTHCVLPRLASCGWLRPLDLGCLVHFS